MTWRDTFRTAVDAVRAHRLRSVLTMLGILIGITAVILTVGLGQGAKADVQAKIDELGTNLLVITPGSSTNSTGSRGGLGSSSTLTFADAEALADRAAVPDGQAVAPVSTRSVSLTAGSTNWTTSLLGTTPSWQEVRSRTVTTGRFLTAADEAGAKPVVVLGPDTATELFGSANAAVGSTVTYNGNELTVVGVLEALSSSETTSNNDLALVPWSTYAQRLVGGTNRESVGTIYLKATSHETLSAAYQEANRLLLNRHGITTPTSADFQIANQESILSAASSVDSTLTVMLAGIAGISLLVGGIGVMNIMLVSVSERVSEIGVRMAVGARRGDILQQFLIEATLVCLIGGFLGVAVALGFGFGFNLLGMSFQLTFSPSSIAYAVLCSTLIGMVFGYLPARNASRLDPVEALSRD